jgi:hypothetical protein
MFRLSTFGSFVDQHLHFPFPQVSSAAMNFQKAVEDAFDRYDIDRSGTIDVGAWVGFGPRQIARPSHNADLIRVLRPFSRCSVSFLAHIPLFYYITQMNWANCVHRLALRCLHGTYQPR